MAIVKQGTYDGGKRRVGYSMTEKSVPKYGYIGNAIANGVKSVADSTRNTVNKIANKGSSFNVSPKRKRIEPRNTVYRNGKPAKVGGNYTLKSYNDFPKRVSSSRKGGNY